MTKDPGVWTAEDCALVLIDYQNEMFEVIRSETPASLVELHVRLLARTAMAYGMPIVVSTVGVKLGFNGPTLPSVLADLDGVEPIDRSSMNAFEDEAFRQAVQATGRRLIIGGLHTEICLAFATVSALQDEYDVLYVTDAVIYWYFNEVPKLTDAPRQLTEAAEMAGRLAGKVCVTTGRGGAWDVPRPWRSPARAHWRSASSAGLTCCTTSLPGPICTGSRASLTRSGRPPARTRWTWWSTSPVRPGPSCRPAAAWS
jgi:nicotinamidase-related amidase